MKAHDITQALGDVGGKWTRQIKAEEKRSSARTYRGSMWTVSRVSLKEICFDNMEEAWNKASGDGRLPTHWRQIFYVMRPICDAHPESDRPLTSETFKGILESYLRDYSPGWDVLRGARGVFKEPHAAENDSGLPMSTMNVRGYLQEKSPSHQVSPVSVRYPTAGAENRIAAVLICEKEGFDDLLVADKITARYDLALMSTKGISAIAARDLASRVGAPCFTLHDMDKNGFVMAAGFPNAVDIGIRMEDVEEWGLDAESQYHKNPDKAYNNLISNGATTEEARFVAEGQRVELNMLTGPDFIEFVEKKLQANGVEKVIPDNETLELAWERIHVVWRINDFISEVYEGDPDVDLDDPMPEMPGDLRERLREEFKRDDSQAWDDALHAVAIRDNTTEAGS